MRRRSVDIIRQQQIAWYECEQYICAIVKETISLFFKFPGYVPAAGADNKKSHKSRISHIKRRG
jgi:hypothetical protein